MKTLMKLGFEEEKRKQNEWMRTDDRDRSAYPI
jgi:hypothetical protein